MAMNLPLVVFRGFNDEAAAMDRAQRSAAQNGMILKCAVRTRNMDQCAKMANEIDELNDWNAESIQWRLYNLRDDKVLDFHENESWKEQNIDKWLKAMDVDEYVERKLRAWEKRKEHKQECEGISTKTQDDTDTAPGKQYQFVPYKPHRGR